ncbi:hypothetical protein [Parapedobacter koreensis]|uniref:Putative transferase, LIC12162 family n=1 Tax=Parapedobacter koreensis TaxID=332977 RepID=A0A1H7T6B5_9SPHI|nr:hypothetical protein [Parapedobacter koreensis]SEL80343.1 putative transferase, LIC12162 family [Parapedobacter koreensis]
MKKNSITQPVVHLENANGYEYGLVFQQSLQIAAHALMRIHGKGNERTWKILLFRYVVTAIKYKSLFANVNHVPFDNIALRAEMSTSTCSGSVSKISKVLNAIKSLIKGIISPTTLTIPSGNYSFGIALPGDLLKEIPLNSRLLWLRPLNRKANMRSNLQKIANEIPDPFKKKIIENIPKVYVEYFDYYWNHIDVEKAGGISFHVHFTIKDFLKEFVIAKCILNGAKLYCYQHGGFYGELAEHFILDFEREIADRFVTWGWAYNIKDLPLGSDKLLKFKNRYQQFLTIGKVERILLPLPYIRDDLARSSDFIDYLNFVLIRLANSIFRYNVCVRYRRDILDKEKSSAKSKIIDVEELGLKIDDFKVPSYESIKQSELVLLPTHPSTMFLECISVDHPVIAICPDTSLLHSNYLKQMQPLMTINLVFTSVEEAIDFLEKTNVEKWWKMVVTSSIYKKFKSSYASTFDLKNELDREGGIFDRALQITAHRD